MERRAIRTPATVPGGGRALPWRDADEPEGPRNRPLVPGGIGSVRQEAERDRISARCLGRFSSGNLEASAPAAAERPGWAQLRSSNPSVMALVSGIPVRAMALMRAFISASGRKGLATRRWA